MDAPGSHQGTGGGRGASANFIGEPIPRIYPLTSRGESGMVAGIRLVF
jgi:hypothetical protein